MYSNFILLRYNVEPKVLGTIQKAHWMSCSFQIMTRFQNMNIGYMVCNQIEHHLNSTLRLCSVCRLGFTIKSSEMIIAILLWQTSDRHRWFYKKKTKNTYNTNNFKILKMKSFPFENRSYNCIISMEILLYFI